MLEVKVFVLEGRDSLPVSPAKAPRKRGKKTIIDFGKPYGGLKQKRKYVKSGKYAKKVTTKKK